MRIIILDTEQERLDSLETMILRTERHAEIRKYLDPDSLFSEVRSMNPDIAFLRIEMEPPDGLIIGRMLSGMFPRVNLIFMAQGEQFAAEALKLRASGYLTGPISEENVAAELRGLRYPPQSDNPIRFSDGNEIYAGKELIPFKYSKTRELLEHLIRKKGSVFSTAELEQILWPGEMKSHRSYLQNVISDLSSALKGAGCKDILIRRRGWIGIKEDAVQEVAKMAG